MQAQAYDVLWWWERWHEGRAGAPPTSQSTTTPSPTSQQPGLPPWYVSPQQLAQCNPTIALISMGTGNLTPDNQYVTVNISSYAVSGYNPSVCQLVNGIGYIGGPAPSVSVNTLQSCTNVFQGCTGWTQLSQGTYWVESTSASSLDTNAVIYLPQPGSYTFVAFYGYEYNGSVYYVGSYTLSFTYTKSWIEKYWWVIPLAAGGAAAAVAVAYFLLAPPPEEVAG